MALSYRFAPEAVMRQNFTASKHLFRFPTTVLKLRPKILRKQSMTSMDWIFDLPRRTEIAVHSCLGTTFIGKPKSFRISQHLCQTPSIILQCTLKVFLKQFLGVVGFSQGLRVQSKDPTVDFNWILFVSLDLLSIVVFLLLTSAVCFPLGSGDRFLCNFFHCT
jgi:hypothetical protein